MFAGDDAKHAVGVESRCEHGADAVLVGRASRAAGGWQARWTLLQGDETSEWRGSIDEGVHGAADKFAGVFAAGGGQSDTPVIISVSGIGGLGAYAQVTDPDARAASVPAIHFIQGLFDKILGEAGVRPNFTLQLRDTTTGKLNGRCPWVFTSFKQSGRTRYAILHRNHGVLQLDLPDIPVTMQFAEPGVIYDVVAGKLLGRGDSVDLTMVNATGGAQLD